MNTIKHTLLSLSTLAALLFVTSCGKGEDPAPNGGSDSGELSVEIKFNGDEFKTLNPSDEDLIAIQIYEVVDGGTLIPYANGLFGDWRALHFEGATTKSYKVEATMVVDAATSLAQEGGVYGAPLYAAEADEFNYCEEPLRGIASSRAALLDGEEYEVPTLDRYYGNSTESVKKNDATIEVAMRRVSFGVTTKGIDENLELQIEGAPLIEIAPKEVVYLSLTDIISAYNADESASPYRELFDVELLRQGVVVVSDEIYFQRNKLATISIEKGEHSFGFSFETPFDEPAEPEGPTEPEEPEITVPEGSLPYVTRVLDYLPAPSQFTNKMPLYEEGDDQESMNQKVLSAVGGGNSSLVTLGGYGGYVVVGFDHTIVNRKGERDFKVLGNGFYNEGDPLQGTFDGGSCEPGIIVVAYDANKNGVPDDDEWFEIGGSAHRNVSKELWFDHAKENGNDVNFYSDFTITYQRPTEEPSSKDEYATYISWSDNKGNDGYLPKNAFHRQCYYPQWCDAAELTFSGSRLPQNAVDEGVSSSYFVLYKFAYGYSDNDKNNGVDSEIDIAWAIDKDGNSVDLPGVDFVKVYTGVNQLNGMIGECSTEFGGVIDLGIEVE